MRIVRPLGRVSLVTLILLCGGPSWPAAPESRATRVDGAALSAASMPAGLPPAPKGYGSPLEVMTAIALKQITLIDPKLAVPGEVVETKNIEYGKVGERSLQLDLYQPAGLTKAVPCLIFIHGGAWSGGSRDVYKFYTVRYAQRGYVAATVSYRLVGEAPFPAAVQDVKCAVRWLRAHAAQYHVDATKLAVVGGSAGGHLAMMIGYSADSGVLEDSGGNPGVSSRVAAVVNFYGPFDLTTPFARTNSIVIRFLSGKTYSEAPELYAQASPAHFLKQGAPPTLIFHGTIDDVVPIDQADTLASRLKELGVPFVYDRLAGWPHTFDLADSVNQHCRAVMNRFLDQHLPLPR